MVVLLTPIVHCKYPEQLHVLTVPSDRAAANRKMSNDIGFVPLRAAVDMFLFQGCCEYTVVVLRVYEPFVVPAAGNAGWH